jgi:hypothetical protein
MGRPTNASIFLRHVREAGGTIGNVSLQRSLAWPEDRYWSVHAELLDAGVIASGRGRGGSVILVVPETDEHVQRAVNALPETEAESVWAELREAVGETSAVEQVRELDLYAPALKQLQKHWSQRKQLLHGAYEVTALQGRRDTGGNWSRPDVVGVGLRKFEYLPDRVMEVYTFEIKPEYDVSIKGVLEALAHREVATRAYVLYYVGTKPWDDFSEAQRIEQLAARHGVGVIVASDIDDLNGCWDERVSATRSGSDPEALDRFIKSTLSEETKSQIRRWF